VHLPATSHHAAPTSGNAAASDTLRHSSQQQQQLQQPSSYGTAASCTTLDGDASSLGLPSSGLPTSAGMSSTNSGGSSGGRLLAPRIYTFAIGPYCNHYFLKLLAALGRGLSDVAFRPHAIRAVMERMLAAAALPVLSDVTLCVQGLRDLQLYPFPIPDVFVGGPLLVSGKFEGEWPEQSEVRGIMADETSELVQWGVRGARVARAAAAASAHSRGEAPRRPSRRVVAALPCGVCVCVCAPVPQAGCRPRPSCRRACCPWTRCLPRAGWTTWWQTRGSKVRWHDWRRQAALHAPPAGSATASACVLTCCARAPLPHAVPADNPPAMVERIVGASMASGITTPFTARLGFETTPEKYAQFKVRAAARLARAPACSRQRRTRGARPRSPAARRNTPQHPLQRSQQPTPPHTHAGRRPAARTSAASAWPSGPSAA
jgi:hypothetical protein